jgi:rhamnose utilization protein RhaD (predicted bifunctional aldolase and dehydrogenase)/NAD(P)-dependent dehydrogenase (short-subunit alcohol dehydrogenase family)
MKSAWSDDEAKAAIERWADRAGSNEDVALRVYTSRLVGQAPALVLHGGGNTSVKTTLPDDLGRPTEVLCVKGSGWDLGDIEPAGLPAVRLETLAALRSLPVLSDEAMVNAARVRLLDAGAPNPSVETLLHAFLPHKFIDHSHADAILAVVDQPDATRICAEIWGDRLAIVPYIMPGFALAKLAAEVYEAHPSCEGLLLLQHGLFTFGGTARESYERHVRAVSEAEAWLKSHRRPSAAPARVPDVDWAALAPVLRGALGQGTPERRYVLHLRTSDAIRAFVDHPELEARSGRGPVTPDHVIRTKPWPMVLRPPASAGELASHVKSRIDAFAGRYREYVAEASRARGRTVVALDPDPRIVLVPGLGLVAIGETEKAAKIAADVYEHTVDVIDAAEAAGRYQALPETDLFDMEYWSLEQAKLGSKAAPPLQGQVVIVTGAASGIGAATARRFTAAGAHVALFDRDEAGVKAVAQACKGAAWVVDMCDRSAVGAAVRTVVERFGGLDGIVSNAGTAPQAAIDTCPPELLHESLEVNLLSHQWLASAAMAVLRAQGRGGWLLFNASKAAWNPGAGFGPYAIAKAGLLALMKQYALEGGSHRVRANAVNADRIRTRLLDEDDVRARAAARGLDADAYFKSNLLGREVTAEDVADAFFALATAPSTTGAVMTVDGGNIAASPR